MCSIYFISISWWSHHDAFKDLCTMLTEKKTSYVVKLPVLRSRTLRHVRFDCQLQSAWQCEVFGQKAAARWITSVMFLQQLIVRVFLNAAQIHRSHSVWLNFTTPNFSQNQKPTISWSTAANKQFQPSMNRFSRLSPKQTFLLQMIFCFSPLQHWKLINFCFQTKEPWNWQLIHFFFFTFYTINN